MRRPIVSSGATSSTVATSPTRTPPPMTRFRTSSSEWNSPSGRTMKREPFSVISPALTEKFDDSSSLRSSSTSTPYAATRVGSTSTRTSFGSTPSSSTRATPSRRSMGRLRNFSSVSYWSVRSVSEDRRMTVTGWSRGAEREHQDAVGGGRQLRAYRVELGAHLERRLLRVAIPVEEHRELRFVGPRRRLDLLDAGQRRKRLLDGANDELFHLLGRRAGVGDGHLHSREGDVREILEPQQLRRDQSDREHGQEHHHRRDGAVERETGVAHGEPQPVAGSAAASGAGVGGA